MDKMNDLSLSLFFVFSLPIFGSRSISPDRFSSIRLGKIKGVEKKIFDEVRGKDKTRERNRRQKQEKETEGIDENSIRNEISIYEKGREKES